MCDQLFQLVFVTWITFYYSPILSLSQFIVRQNPAVIQSSTGNYSPAQNPQIHVV